MDDYFRVGVCGGGGAVGGVGWSLSGPEVAAAYQNRRPSSTRRTLRGPSAVFGECRLVEDTKGMCAVEIPALWDEGFGSYVR